MNINIINTTTDSLITAREIAEYLVKKKLSPCIQIVPLIESIYKWKRKLQHSKELLLIIKTAPQHVQKCKRHILELHNYDIPEIIVTESEIVHDMYKEWFLENITQ